MPTSTITTVTFPVASTGTVIVITSASPRVMFSPATDIVELTLLTVKLVLFELDRYCSSPTYVTFT